MWKILVVDDEVINLRLLREMLAEHATCNCVETGKAALTAFSAAFDTDSIAPYDIMLLDIAMPEMDGIEVVKRIRRFEEQRGILLGKGVPIIMVTAFKEPFMDAFQEGADAYLIKPIDQNHLIEIIREQLTAHAEQE